MWSMRLCQILKREEEQSLYLARYCRTVCLHWDMMKKGIQMTSKTKHIFATVRGKIGKVRPQLISPAEFWSTVHGTCTLLLSCTLNKKSDINLIRWPRCFSRGRKCHYMNPKWCLPYQHTALCCPAVKGSPPHPTLPHHTVNPVTLTW